MSIKLGSILMAGVAAGSVLASSPRVDALPAGSHGFADLEFTNGKVITVDGHDTIAKSVAIVGNSIVAIGEVADWTGPRTRIVDLKGRALLPGFIDSHSHVEGMANTEAPRASDRILRVLNKVLHFSRIHALSRC